MTANDFKLALKLIDVSKGAKFSSYAPSQQGEVNLTNHAEFLSDEPNGKEVLRGAHVGRYEFQEDPKQGSPKYLDVQKFLKSHGLKTKAHDYRYIRIGYQRGSAIDNWRRIISTIIQPENFCSDTINYIVNPIEINLFTILSLLNSTLWEWRFRLTSTNNHVNSYEIDGMPMINFNFVTPESERKNLLEKGKRFYDNCINKAGTNDVTGFLGHQLSIRPERNDVVHDILAFLAERMIEMNKDKQQEINGFLEWLGNQLKIQSDAKGNNGIDALTGKTQLKNYIGDYQKEENHLSFKEFWNILENNKNKIQANLKSRELYENVHTEYEKSLSKLLPLKEKLRKTDWLIDQIVYKLYGLTEEEIRIVEGKNQ